ncbi:hypothetical protein FRB96_002443 [Tulasnella sp. 330]|nr:hypothetical protein FRB96_002443 [Tulasnella sp. 330]KAG8885612.1 hypothetical protein FRB97_000520 [Tulasnella sp. 331]
MTSTFTRTEPVTMEKEKDWAYELGLMDWDKTKIVFTKRQLVDFLGYAGIPVNPNLSNIAKLPKYASFGKMSDEVACQPVAQAAPVAQPTQAAASTSPDEFKPTRRVREAPGGFQTDIFGEYEETDPQPRSTAVTKEQAADPEPQAQAQQSAVDPSMDEFKPTRRVREAPGGRQTDIFGGFGEEQEAFKPTRRVRAQPGGEDNINGIFG